MSNLISTLPVACYPYGVDPQTGICLGLQLGPYRLLLDCGLADLSCLQDPISPPDQSPPDQRRLSQPVDYVVCSQAHLHYVQGLAALHQAYPQLPIYTSNETQQLWHHISGDPWTSHCSPIAWNAPFALSPDLTLEFIPAGQLPGAAVCLLTYRTTVEGEMPDVYTVAYMGDFSLTHTRLTQALPIADLKERPIDLLILKGGYGTQHHPVRKQQDSAFIQTLLGALAAKQSILIPVPQVGLGQEILMLLRTHAAFNPQPLTIWVDEGVAQGCEAYTQILPLLPSTLQNFARQQPLFWQPKGRLQIKRLDGHHPEGMTQLPGIFLIHDPKTLQYYRQRLGDRGLIMQPIFPDSSDGLDAGTTGLEAELYEESTTWPIQPFLLALASDGPSTTQLIHNLRPQHVAFFHHSPLVVQDLTQVGELQHRYKLHPLTVGERLEVIQQPRIPHETIAPSLQTYAGELLESTCSATLSLSAEILDDPRWQVLADTGLVEASWQGNQLVIRGLSQADIIRHSASQYSTSNRSCCAGCYFYRQQRCWQSESALYGFKVSPQGTCPVYEPNDPVLTADLSLVDPSAPDV